MTSRRERTRSVNLSVLNQSKDNPVSHDDQFIFCEKEFQTLFGHLSERLIAYFICSCQGDNDDIAYQGKIFVSEKYLCFATPQSKDHLKIIPFANVMNVLKRNTLLVFDNALGVNHKFGSEFFVAFTSATRDKAYEIIEKVWAKQKIKYKQRKSHMAPVQPVNQFKIESAEKPSPAPDGDENNEHVAILIGGQRGDAEEVETETLDLADLRTSTAELQQVKETEHKAESVNTSSGSVGGGAAANNAADGDWQRAEPVKEEKPLDMSVLKPGANNNNSNSNSEGSSENASDNSDNKSEQQPKQAVPKPSGVYADHIKIAAAPVVNEVFENITLIEFYEKLIYSQEYWKMVLEKAENYNVVVAPFTPAGKSNEVFKRECTFMAPIKGAPMGPKQTRVVQNHAVSFPSEKELILETVNQSLDIPVYGESFLVESLWSVKEEGPNCRLIIRWYVHFIKSVWVKSMIEKGAKSATEESFVIWVKAAKEWLKSGKGNAPVSNNNNNKPVPEAKPVEREQNAAAATKGFSPAPHNAEVRSPVVSKPDKDAILVQLPFTEQIVTLKLVSLIVISIILILGFTQLYWQVRSLEGENTRWKNAFAQFDDRLVFLQEFATQLATYTNQDERSLEMEWIYWQHTNGLDWRLAEWQDQMLILQETLSTTLAQVTNVLEHARPVEGVNLLSERKLRALISDYDTSKVVLKRAQSSSWSWWTIIAGTASFACVVGGGAFMFVKMKS